MATVTIRGLDDDVRDRLRARAAQHGRSMEAEIREILADSVAPTSPAERGLGSLIHSSFAGAGLAVELERPAWRDEPLRHADDEAVPHP